MCKVPADTEHVTKVTSQEESSSGELFTVAKNSPPSSQKTVFVPRATFALFEELKQVVKTQKLSAFDLKGEDRGDVIQLYPALDWSFFVKPLTDFVDEA